MGGLHAEPSGRGDAAPGAGADFDTLAENLRTLGYRKPSEATGVWRGGIDLVSRIDPTISPELQYVVLLADQHLVVYSDTSSYAAVAGKAARGDAASIGPTVWELTGALGSPANAMIWAKDFACEDLAMSSADDDAQAEADTAVREAGGVSTLTGLAMAMDPDRSLHVVEQPAQADQATENLRPRARLAVGQAVRALGAPSPTTSG